MSKPKLRKVADRSEETERLSSGERLYRDKVEPLMIRIARGVDERGRPGLFCEGEFITSKKEEAEAVERMLAERSVRSMEVSDFLELSEGENMLARLDEKYISLDHKEWHLVVSRPPFMPDWIGKEAYVFRSEDLAADNPYLGMRFPEIRRSLAREHGEESEQVR
jgi:hypothetical protein